MPPAPDADGRKPPVPRVEGYEVLESLGAGAMGVVYKARQKSLDRIVALKVLATHLTKDSRFARRFNREAHAAGQLNHPNVVRGIDFGESNGVHYFAMEFIEGQDLGKILKAQGPIPEAQALKIAEAVAKALRSAWKAKILHRDIKPSNIMITTERGEVKLADLGLAKELRASDGDGEAGPDGEEGADGATEERPLADLSSINPSVSLSVSILAEGQTLTKTGTVLGTPYYMSPEQIRMEKAIDIRSDIYSLGATLFHAVSGRPPYRGKSVAEVFQAAQEGRWPSLRQFRPDVSLPFESLIRIMSARDALRRFQTPDDLLAGIASVGKGEMPVPSPPKAAIPKPARPVRAPAPAAGPAFKAAGAPSGEENPEPAAPPARGRLVVPAAAAAVLVLVVGAILLLSGRGGSRPPDGTPREKEPPAAAQTNARAEFERRAAAQAEKDRKREAGAAYALKGIRGEMDRKGFETAKAMARKALDDYGGTALDKDLKEIVSAADKEIAAARETANQVQEREAALLCEEIREAIRTGAFDVAVAKAQDGMEKFPSGTHAADLSDFLKSAELEKNAKASREAEAKAVEERAAKERERLAREANARERLAEIRKTLGKKDYKGAAAMAEAAKKEFDGTGSAAEISRVLEDALEAEAKRILEKTLRPTPEGMVTNSIKMKLVRIPPGELQAEDSQGKAGKSGKRSSGRVISMKGFYLGATEVTQAQWESLMGKALSDLGAEKRLSGEPRERDGEYPIQWVSWQDATEFCRRLSRKEKKVYRLPTESEWEYACRAGTKTGSVNGDNEVAMDEIGWFLPSSGGHVHPVGRKKPNAWGLYDMHGNLWEHCQDEVPDNPLGKRGDPMRLEYGERRLLCGGCYLGSAESITAKRRYALQPDRRVENFGLRVLLEGTSGTDAKSKTKTEIR